MSRAEKALIESEQLLKSFGVTMEAGRQTRSSRRSTVVESPKPETPKRKQLSTPRATKKAKIVVIDQTDGTNHVNSEPQVKQFLFFHSFPRHKIHQFILSRLL